MIGHNLPPLGERLAMDHATLAAGAASAAQLVPPEVRAIESDEEAGDFAETAKALKEVAKTIEKARVSEKEQIIKDGRTVETFFAGLSQPIKDGIDKLVGAINRFQSAKLAAERKAQAEAAEKARLEAVIFDEPPPVEAPVVVREAARVVSSGGALASASTKWTHEVLDPSLVPRNYLCVNEAAVKAAVAGGLRAIPGVRIFETVRTAIR
jgi:hypothetical protein